MTTRVRQLEEDLGVALFIREGKKLHLSPAGQTLLGYTDRLLDLAEGAREAVQDAEPRGTLRGWARWKAPQRYTSRRP